MDKGAASGNCRNSEWTSNVVGHTDNQGGYDYNLKLSKDWANAVVKVLVAQCDVGPMAPVALNLTEKGRAKNRRVDLAAQ